ncbi:MAG TPA: hypothetical protein VLA48_00675 [Nitrososphaeraceae archaeon]|nr:hypothetical protein [Nitrososphaeraceae archaeon]
MKYLNFIIIVTVIVILAGTLVANNNNVFAQNLNINASSGITQSVDNETYSSFEKDKSSLNNYQKSQTFTHGIVVKIDNIGYYFDGPADGANGTKDAPGHYWWQDTPTHLYGLHYNIGPFGEEQWWSSDAKGNELLYIVNVIIAPWTNNTAYEFAKQGYVHYHELVRTDNGEKHPELVAWFKHVAVPAAFILDKGAMPEDKHIVGAGIDYRFLNNYFIPYNPQADHGHYE